MFILYLHTWLHSCTSRSWLLKLLKTWMPIWTNVNVMYPVAITQATITNRSRLGNHSNKYCSGMGEATRRHQGNLGEFMKIWESCRIWDIIFSLGIPSSYLQQPAATDETEKHSFLDRQISRHWQKGIWES